MSNRPKILVITKATGYVHDSAIAAENCLQNLAKEQQWSIVNDENAFNHISILNQYDVIVFAHTSGNFLSYHQQSTLRAFVESGGKGIYGLHSAIASFLDETTEPVTCTWPWFASLMAAHFLSHPVLQKALVHFDVQKASELIGLDPTHCKDKQWIEDEWYELDRNPSNNNNIVVIASVEESSYNGGNMGDVHPVVWLHQFQGTRVFYNGLGHTCEIFTSDVMKELLLKGIRWCLNR